MSHKLGFYLHSSQDEHGLWSKIERVKPPVILIHMDTKNDDLLNQMRDWRSPNTFVIGRFYLTNAEQEALLDRPDPAQAGRDLADRLYNTNPSFVAQRFPRDNPAGRLLVDAWMSLNECVPGPSWDEWAAKRDEQPKFIRRAANYDLLQVAFRSRLRELVRDVEAVAFNFGSGNFQQADQYIQQFPRTLESYKYLGFHEYGWPALSATLADPKQPVKSDAGKFRQIMDGIRAKYGAQHEAIITEAGLARAHLKSGDLAGDVGWLNTVEPLTQDACWKSLAWYNGVLTQRPDVKGACLYEVGWVEKWKSFRLTGAFTDAQGQEQPIKIIDWIAEQMA